MEKQSIQVSGQAVNTVIINRKKHRVASCKSGGGGAAQVKNFPANRIFNLLFYFRTDTVSMVPCGQNLAGVRLTAALRGMDFFRFFRDQLQEEEGTVPGGRMMRTRNGQRVQVVGSLVSEIEERCAVGGIYSWTTVLQLTIQQGDEETVLLAREQTSLFQASQHILPAALHSVQFREECGPGSRTEIQESPLQQARIQAVILMEQLAENLSGEQGDYALLRGVDRFQIVRPSQSADGYWVLYDQLPVESFVQLILSLGTVPRPPAERLACLYYLETIGQLQTMLDTNHGLSLLQLRKYCQELFPVLAGKIFAEDIHQVLGPMIAELLLFLVNHQQWYGHRKIIADLKKSTCVFSECLAMDSWEDLGDRFKVFDQLHAIYFSVLLSGFRPARTINRRMRELKATVLHTTRRINDDHSWTPLMVKERFNLERVWPGNWVTNGEWQIAMELIGEALTDLEAVLGRKVFNWLTGNFLLQIAYGAKGHGMAAAHYKQEDVHTINLTRFRGDGCLAHEFGHYLDRGLGNVFAIEPSNMENDGPLFLSECITRVGRCRLPAAVELLHGMMWKQESLTGKNVALAGVPDHTAVNIKVKTDFYRNAQRLTACWRRPTELFARVFECWVADSLAACGVQSPGLVGDTSHSSLYPQGEERRKMNTLMKKMMESITGNFI